MGMCFNGQVLQPQVLLWCGMRPSVAPTWQEETQGQSSTTQDPEGMESGAMLSHNSQQPGPPPPSPPPHPPAVPLFLILAEPST